MATYDDHLRLTGQRVVDFLLVLIQLFSLSVTAEALRANIGSKSAISLQHGPGDPPFQVEGVAPTNHSSFQKIRLNGLSYVIKICTDLTSVLSQCTRLADRRTDKRTDSFLIAIPRLHSMQHGKYGEITFPYKTVHTFSDTILGLHVYTENNYRLLLAT